MTKFNNLNAIVAALEERFTHSLPGVKTQELMAPSFRNDYKADKNRKRQSGVLLLLYPKNKTPHLALIKRSSKLRTHSGQIGFPGGQKDPTDTSYYDTATRETYEELGVHKDQITFLGKLTPLFIPISNFMVHPFVAYSTEELTFTLNPFEVEELLEIPLSEILNKNTITEESWLKNDKKYYRPFFDLKNHKVWGATAMILNEFRHLLLFK